MAWLWEAWTDADFLKNIYAGAVFFVFEIVFIVWLLNLWQDRRWKRARIDLCDALMHSIGSATDALQTPEDDDEKLDDDACMRRAEKFEQQVSDVIKTFSQALTPELMRLGIEVMHESSTFRQDLFWILVGGFRDKSSRQLEATLQKVKEMYRSIGELESARAKIHKTREMIGAFGSAFDRYTESRTELLPVP